MAQPYGTGSVHVFLQPPNKSAPIYFGTPERMPEDSRQPEYEAVMNDISGTKVPLDFAFEGESAQISLVMTRWNEPLYQLIQTKVANTINTPGSWRLQDVGTLMGLEQQTFTIWLAYLFGSALSAKPAFAFLPPGRRYLQAIMWAPESDETGTAPMKRHVMFYAWPALMAGTQRATGGTSGGSTALTGFSLYDANFTGISASMIT